MSRRQTKLDTYADSDWLKDLVNATWNGDHKWYRSGSRWTTKWRHSWRMYLTGSAIRFTKPVKDDRNRWTISSLSAAQIGSLLEAIIFTQENKEESNESISTS